MDRYRAAFDDLAQANKAQATVCVFDELNGEDQQRLQGGPICEHSHRSVVK